MSKLILPPSGLAVPKASMESSRMVPTNTEPDAVEVDTADGLVEMAGRGLLIAVKMLQEGDSEDLLPAAIILSDVQAYLAEAQRLILQRVAFP